MMANSKGFQIETVQDSIQATETRGSSKGNPKDGSIPGRGGRSGDGDDDTEDDQGWRDMASSGSKEGRQTVPKWSVLA